MFRPHARLLIVTLTVLAFTAVGLSSPAAHAAHVARPKRTTARDYLALGDSVPFGYREASSRPSPPDYGNPVSLVGYPELVASALHLKLTNAACPGETTASFITPGAQSNGCESSPGGLPGYRSLYPLHTPYSGTQLAFALKYLNQHHGQVGLITLMIGANDGFLCQATTADHCASESGALLSGVGARVAKILKTIRGRGHYDGRIVLVDYYSLDYRDLSGTLASRAIDSTLASAAQPYRVRIADAFDLYAGAAAPAGGDSCAAGLLTALSVGGCGVHPSLAGQSLLAYAVEKKVRRANR